MTAVLFCEYFVLYLSSIPLLTRLPEELQCALLENITSWIVCVDIIVSKTVKWFGLEGP